jgi:hypothetical protein
MMDDLNKTIPIFSGSVVETQKLKNDLENAGIQVMLKNFDFTAANAGFANVSNASLELSILENDIEKAKPVIENFKRRFGL